MSGEVKALGWNAIELDRAASRILGSRPLEVWVSKDGKTAKLPKQKFRLAYLREIGEIYEPHGDITACKPTKLQRDKNVCLGCGAPRADGSAGTCRRCYLNAAKKKHSAAVAERNLYLETTAPMIEFWQDLWAGHRWQSTGDGRTRTLTVTSASETEE